MSPEALILLHFENPENDWIEKINKYLQEEKSSTNKFGGTVRDQL